MRGGAPRHAPALAGKRIVVAVRPSEISRELKHKSKIQAEDGSIMVMLTSPE
jgi:hypothetical protein